jgi:hypothetical protein
VPTNAPSAIPSAAPSSLPTSAPTLDLPYPIISLGLDSFVTVLGFNGELTAVDKQAASNTTNDVFNAITGETSYINTTYRASGSSQSARALATATAIVHLRSLLTTDQFCTVQEALAYFKGRMTYAVQNTTQWMDQVSAATQSFPESALASSTANLVTFEVWGDAVVMETSAYKCDAAGINSITPRSGDTAATSSFAFTTVFVYILIALVLLSLLYAAYANRDRIKAAWGRLMGGRKDRSLDLHALKFGHAEELKDPQLSEDLTLEDLDEISLQGLQTSSCDWSTCSSELASLSDLEASPDVRKKKPFANSRKPRNLYLTTLGKYFDTSADHSDDATFDSQAQPVGIADLPTPSKVRKALFESFKRKRSFRSRRSLQLQELGRRQEERAQVVDKTVQKLTAVQSKELGEDAAEESDSMTCSSTSDESVVDAHLTVERPLRQLNDVPVRAHHALKLSELGFANTKQSRKSRTVEIQELGRFGRTNISPTACAAHTAKSFNFPVLSNVARYLRLQQLGSKPRKDRSLDLQRLKMPTSATAGYYSTDESTLSCAEDTKKTLKRTSSMPTKKSARVSFALLLHELGVRSGDPASADEKRLQTKKNRKLNLQELGAQGTTTATAAADRKNRTLNLQELRPQGTTTTTATATADRKNRTLNLQELGAQGTTTTAATATADRKNRTLNLQELGAQGTTTTAATATADRKNRTLNLQELGPQGTTTTVATATADRKNRTLNLQELGAQGSTAAAVAVADKHLESKMNRKLNLQELGAQGTTAAAVADKHLESKMNRKLNLQELGAQGSNTAAAVADKHLESKMNRKLNLQELGTQGTTAAAVADRHLESKMNRKLNLQQLGRREPGRRSLPAAESSNADAHWSSDEDCESANGERLSESSTASATAAAEPTWLEAAYTFLLGDASKQARKLDLHKLGPRTGATLREDQEEYWGAEGITTEE